MAQHGQKAHPQLLEQRPADGSIVAGATRLGFSDSGILQLGVALFPVLLPPGALLPAPSPLFAILSAAGWALAAFVAPAPTPGAAEVSEAAAGFAAGVVRCGTASAVCRPPIACSSCLCAPTGLCLVPLPAPAMRGSKPGWLLTVRSGAAAAQGGQTLQLDRAVPRPRFACSRAMQMQKTAASSSLCTRRAALR